MLDKRKIRLMTKLELYDRKQGAKDVRISDYNRKDYVGYHKLTTFLWVTFGYVLFWGLVAVSIMDDLMKNLTTGRVLFLILLAVIGYVVVISGYLVLAHRLYNKRHAQARKRMRGYNHGLIRLLKMYERVLMKF